MRGFIILFLFFSLTSACIITTEGRMRQPTSEVTQTNLAELPPPSIHTISPDATQTLTIPESLETATIPTLTIGPTTIIDPPAQPGIGLAIPCGEAFIAKVTQPPEFEKDLFEHHARGTFLIVLLEMLNVTDQPIQIWDEDYYLTGTVNKKMVTLTPHKAATGYLFIVRGNDLNQDQIEPGITWRTYLAFDINPQGTHWVLVVKPGSEWGKPVCEVSIPLTQ